MNKKLVGLGLAALAVFSLTACRDRSSSSESSEVKPAIVTDKGGVDDKSFNQSAWEGMQKWGKEQKLEKDKGFTYFQSDDESQYTPNLNAAAAKNYNLIYGVGFALQSAVEEEADGNTNINYVLIDGVIEGKDNVASVTFADQEASYLAGVAAAKSTKTNHVGFIGGQKSDVIDRFEAGFVAGVKSVNPNIQITVDYAGGFRDSSKGQTLAAAQYAAGADIIFHASGETGNGVFAAAKSENETRNEADKVWVIGVDRDQSAEGNYTSKDGKDSNFVLASTLKEVGTAVKDIADKSLDNKFPGGKAVTYALKDGGVDLVETNLSDDASKAVADAKQSIKDKKVDVPEKP